MSDKYNVEYLEVGDSFEGGPIEQGYFISAVMAAGGEVEIDGNVVTILQLPKAPKSEAKAPASPAPVEVTPEPVEEAKEEAPKEVDPEVAIAPEPKPAAKPGPKPKAAPEKTEE